MIRILHTADWHIGQTLRGFSRMAEHRAALDHVVAIAADEKIDALILAGDVFDTQSPRAEAETLFFDTLAKLRRACPMATLIITAGNHDLAGRIEAPQPLFKAVGVHAVGTIRRVADGKVDLDHHLIAVRDKDGVIGAHVLALPYPRAADLPGLASVTDEAGSSVVREVRRLYGETLAAARAHVGALPLIATGHLHVLGGMESEGAERAILVGGQHAVPPEIFGADVDYVALGHLHRPQGIGRDTIRYAGSLFPLSATERNYRHGVTVLTVENGALTFAHRDIPRPVPFLRLPDKGAMPIEEAEAALASLRLDPALAQEFWPFIQLALSLDGPRPGLEAELDRLTQKFPMRFVGHSIERPAAAGEEPVMALDLRLGERDPADLFTAAFLKLHGTEPLPEHRAVFDRARLDAQEAR